MSALLDFNKHIGMLNLYKFFIVFFMFLIFSCQSNNTIEKISTDKNKFDKFEDTYSESRYYNKNLGLVIEFDSDWVIIYKYDNFNDFQKKYSQYFSTDIGEVLFIGFNEKKKIGVRCTCETLDLNNDKYYEKLKNENKTDAVNFKITYLSAMELILKNINSYQFVFETELNKNNIFTFDCLLFKNKKYNFNLDFWADKNIYSLEKDYILSIYNKIDFRLESEYIEKNKDATNDSKKN